MEIYGISLNGESVTVFVYLSVPVNDIHGGYDGENMIGIE